MTNQNQTISVYFEPIGTPPGVPEAYHETLVYKGADGNIIGIATADHSGTPPADTTLERGEDLVQSEYSVLSGRVADSEGSLITFFGSEADLVATGHYTQGQINALLGDPSPTQVASAPNLSIQWYKIITSYYLAGLQKAPYDPLGNNSNYAATTALIAAGITPPATDITSGHWAPSDDNLKSASSANGAGQEVVTVSNPVNADVLTMINLNPHTLQEAIVFKGSLAPENVDDIKVINTYGNDLWINTGDPPPTTVSGDSSGNVTLVTTIGGQDDTVYVSNASDAVNVTAGSGLAVKFGSLDTVTYGGDGSIIADQGNGGFTDDVTFSDGTTTIEADGLINNAPIYITSGSDTVPAGATAVSGATDLTVDSGSGEITSATATLENPFAPAGTIAFGTSTGETFDFNTYAGDTVTANDNELQRIRISQIRRAA